MTPEIQTGIGKPSQCPDPMNPNEGPSRVMGNPPVHNIVSPRAMLSIPSVATNGGSLKRVMTNPLNQPSTVPTIRPAAIAPETVTSKDTSVRGTATPFFSNPAATAPDRASTDPTERSIPPERMISVMPTDRHRFAQI